ncbi:tRNA-guanine transglycosylase DpdA [Tolumonas osonensis]|uniref:tRNA-guanine transglycosylase n=1 Tax=Tolumonas osonensis TaxID=675874 RepID=A0A841GJW0_9GAMM|nr:tRNA-guanine transglycosylase DpdA [Tolumonas osonensis]MBB6055491.1 hypothetical protein [Tolumonas osonensis]
MPKLKYFFPDSQDFIDPSFDFIRETRHEHRIRQRDDLYPHEVFSRPYDGMLVSKAVVDGLGSGEARYSRAQRLRFFREGIRRFFRLPDSMESMGDCGAFTYVTQYEPPYRVEEVIDFYESSRFNYGVSVDHIVFGYEKPGKPIDGDDLIECKRRKEITLTLASEFLQKSKGCCFSPFGVAHGWSKESYADSVKALISMGYEHITMGGMVPLKTEQIIETLEEVSRIKKPSTKLHLLGIARPQSLDRFAELGVTSIDSTTPLQQAFKDRKNNYHTFSGQNFVALRVPQLEGNLALGRKIQSGVIDQDVARELERKSLKILHQYGKREVSLEQTLEVLLEYEKLHSGDKHADSVKKDYEVTLSNRPWEQCSCEVCRSIGIDVVIFRGSERNRRRGFHNIQVFYDRLKSTFN